jgi:hypothetical protein
VLCRIGAVALREESFVLGLAMPVSKEIGVVGRQSQACPSSLSLEVVKYKAMLAALFAC